MILNINKKEIEALLDIIDPNPINFDPVTIAFIKAKLKRLKIAYETIKQVQTTENT